MIFAKDVFIYHVVNWTRVHMIFFLNVLIYLLSGSAENVLRWTKFLQQVKLQALQTIMKQTKAAPQKIKKRKLKLKCQIVKKTTKESAVEDNTILKTNAKKREQVSKPTCKYYIKGRCRHGGSGKKIVNESECEFYHPRKCTRYCKFGKDEYRGCEGNCGLFHPILCKNSVNFLSCFKPNCTFTHLMETERNRNHRFHGYENTYQRNYNHRYHGNLAYQNYGTKQITQKDNYYSRKEFTKMSPNFVYNQNDFPRLGQEQLNEMSSAIKRMQSSLDYFMQNKHIPDQGGMTRNIVQPNYNNPNGYHIAHENNNSLHNVNEQVYNCDSKNYQMNN